MRGFLILFAGLCISFQAAGQCNYIKHFEILLNKKLVLNTSSPDSRTLSLAYDSLQDADLFQVKFRECDPSPEAHYELHLLVPELGKDLTFVNDLPDFSMNMGWLTQYRNRKVEIFMYFFDKSYVIDKNDKLVMKVADVLIS